MKLPHLLIPMAAALSQAIVITNEEACYIHHPHRWQSILDFCSNNNIVVPSGFASGGTNYMGKWTKISGNCNPPQWVPELWCRTQFMNMCAVVGPAGGVAWNFGNNNCQTFEIGVD